MSAVVEASLLVGALTGSGEEARWCEAALEWPTIAAPELVLAEATNILRRLELSGAIPRSEAAAAHRDLLQLGIELYPFTPFAGRVWELGPASPSTTPGMWHWRKRLTGRCSPSTADSAEPTALSAR